MLSHNALSDRYQGAWLGAVVGHWLGSLHSQQPPSSGQPSPLHGGHIARQWAQQWVANPSDSTWDTALQETMQLAHLQPIEWAIALLPLWLAYPDQSAIRDRFLGRLLRSLEPHVSAPELFIEVGLFSDLLAHALLYPSAQSWGVSDAFYRLPALVSGDRDWVEPLCRRWETLQVTVDRQLPLAALLSMQATALDDPRFEALNPFEQAIYSALSTPQQFELGVLRSLQQSPNPPLSGALSGALLGAKTGLAAIPFYWRSSFLMHHPVCTPALTDCLQNYWGVADEDDWIELAIQLFNQWAGSYNPRVYSVSLSSIGYPGR